MRVFGAVLFYQRGQFGEFFQIAVHIACLLYTADTRGEGAWRPEYHTRINGNLYPTHGLGPVAQYMNRARGEDQFSRVAAFALSLIHI